MTRTRWIWLALAVLYATFFAWYTSFGGPLREEEIAHYLERFERHDPTSSPEQRATLRRFMEEDTGGDFVMLNVIEMHDTPLQIEGVEPGESSDEVLDRYMAFMLPALLSRACHPVLFGRAAAPAMDLVNADGMATWTTGAAMRYRSRRDLLEIASQPEFAGSHDFKIAAMAKTIAFPLDPWFQLGDPRLVLGLFLGGVGLAIGRGGASRRPR